MNHFQFGTWEDIRHHGCTNVECSCETFGRKTYLKNLGEEVDEEEEEDLH